MAHHDSDLAEFGHLVFSLGGKIIFALAIVQCKAQMSSLHGAS